MSSKLVRWGYAVELIAAALIVGGLVILSSPNAVVTFVHKVAIDISTLVCTVILAAALGFLWSFYAKSDTEFYRWLEGKGAFKVYLAATIYTIAVSFAAAVALIVSKHLEGVAIGLVACYLLVLAVINLYSLIANIAGVMRLNAKFNSIYKTIRRDT